MKKIFCAVLCLILCLGVLASCGSKGPESLFDKMQKAVTEKNAKLLLECYEPSVQEMFKSLMGDNLDSLLDEFGGEEEETATLKLDKVEYTNDSKTTATLTITVSANGQTETQDMPAKLVDGDWYLDLAGALGGAED